MISRNAKLILIVTAIGVVLSSLLLTAQTKPKAQSSEEVHLIASLNGGELYKAYCASCHGLDAKGGGPAASALKVHPANLTEIQKRSGGTFPSARIQEMVSGEKMAAAHGSREMPIWGPIFSQIAWDQDLGKIRILNLTKYIESIQVK